MACVDVSTEGELMKVLQRSLVYDAWQQPVSRCVAFMDSLLRLNSGHWLCGFTVGPEKNHHTGTICICRSTNGGHTWSILPLQFSSAIDGTPGSLSGAEMVETEAGRLLLFTTWFDRSDPDRPLFDPETEGLLPSRQLMAISTDDGNTWSDWKQIPTPGLTGCAMSGPVGKWSDGTIAFVFESFKEFDDTTPVQPAAWLLISRDAGNTFESPFLVAQDPRNEVYYWDQRLCASDAPGEFISLFWTHDRKAQKDLRVHLLRSEFPGDEEAARVPVQTSIPGQIAAPCLLQDGRLLAFVVDRNPPGTMRLWQSFDGGQTWPEAESMVVHQHQEQARLSQRAENIDFAAYWEDMGKWSFGHPCIRCAGQHRVLLTWYAGTPARMSIHAAEVDISIVRAG